MGYRNIDRCLLATPPITDVPGAAYRCLLLMAKAAHDNTQLYWAGIEWLELQMGYEIGPGARRNVMKYLSQLEDAGYISRPGKKRGSRWVYELHLPDLAGPVDNHRS